ncbi:uncharacterized protein LOC141612276 [Silene latifolia]|uniref:uncharacterized protein LOC141612276 n=1 Tax=Silene latifolia TaxID=37657 RepID=UPI003D782757
MDAGNISYSCEVGAVDQNGSLTENHGLGPNSVAEVINGIRGCSMVDVGPDAIPEVIGESIGNKVVEPCIQDVDGLTMVHVETNGSPALEKVETKGSREPKPQKSQGRGRSDKPATIKNTTRPSVKVTNSTIEVKRTSNGTLPAKIRPKQAVVMNKSINDQATNSDLSKSKKITSATSNACKDELPESETSSSGNLMQSEDSVEKSTLKPVRKEPSVKAEVDSESVESAAESDAKSHKVGKLPAYDFNFRCHERAEKRKEFYTKLEQRIHAQEIEKTNQQAKSKESQEAELKMLRKSLNFKATPMPNFYQEPLPPKMELKKIPTTRPRSPRLGRKKNPSLVSVERDSDGTHRPGRLSLDEKAISQQKPSQGPKSIQSKQPQRKSLPRLPSERTRLSKTSVKATPTQAPDNLTNETPSTACLDEEVSPPITEFIPIARPDDEEVHVADLEAMPIARVVEEDHLSQADEAHHGSENGFVVEDETNGRLEQGLVTSEL